MAFFDSLKDRLSGATGAVTDKAKEGAAIARLSNERYAKERELEKLYARIGKACVDTPSSTDELNAMIAEARTAREGLEAIEDELRRLRAKNVCPACGFVADRKARFCPNCGSALMEAGTKADTAGRPAHESEETESITVKPVVTHDFRKDE